MRENTVFYRPKRREQISEIWYLKDLGRERPRRSRETEVKGKRGELRWPVGMWSDWATILSKQLK